MPIRDDVIAYLATNNCNSPFTRKRLLIRVHTTTVEALNPTGVYLDLFDPTLYTVDDTTDYIYLRIFPDYDQENNILGEGGLKNTFSLPSAYAVTTVRRGFKATVTDRRKIISDIITRLVEISKTSAFTRFAPIKVIDFCLSEPGATIVGVEPGTVRWGELKIDNLPGTVGKSYLKNDWSFNFSDVFLRFV